MSQRKKRLIEVVGIAVIVAVLFVTGAQAVAMTVFEDDVEGGVDGWTNESLWHITEQRCSSTSHSWWYGQETTGNYDTGDKNSGCFVSPDIDLTGATAATLYYWTWWQTENYASYDTKKVELSTDGGATWSLLEQLPGGSGSGDRTIDLSLYLNNVVEMRFCFNTRDAKYNNYEGWFVDDVKVEKDVPTMPDLNITEKYETLLPDGNFSVTYNVTNIGDCDAGASTTRIYIEGNSAAVDNVPALNVGTSYTNTVGHFACPCDTTVNVTVCADNDKAVSESNETNNCMVNWYVGPSCQKDIYVNDSGWWWEGQPESFNASDTPIQSAIENASAGGTIIVQDGTYNENVVVNTELTLKAGSIPVIDGSYSRTIPAIHVTADNVLVQGFIIRNFNAENLGADTGAILVEGNNVKVDNNSVCNIPCVPGEGMCPSEVGIDVHADDVEITNNQVYNLSLAGIRVRDDWTGHTGAANNVLVEGNTVNDTDMGVLITGYAKGVTIRNNELHDSDGNVVLQGVDSVAISDNNITGPWNNIHVTSDTFPLSSNDTISTNISIINNNITNAERGVNVNVSGGFTGESTPMAQTTTINYNNIVNNTEYGVENAIGMDVDATYNWWGDCGGPYNPDENPTGTGDNVSVNVCFTPWYGLKTIYMDPQDSNETYCYNVTVDIWLEHLDWEDTCEFKSGQINLTYCPTCANVTNYASNATNFPTRGWTHYAGWDWITFMVTESSLSSGLYHLGTLTVQCNATDECATGLNFSGRSVLFDHAGLEVPSIWLNGSFACAVVECGDVNFDKAVDIGDVGLLHNHVQYNVSIGNEWVADVQCGDGINMGDVGLLHNHVQFGSELNCC